MWRHVAADVNVAELCDAEAVETWRKIVDRNIYFFDAIAKATGSKTVSRCQKWQAAREVCGVAKEFPPRRTECNSAAWTKPHCQVRNPLDRADRLECDEPE